VAEIPFPANDDDAEYYETAFEAAVALFDEIEEEEGLGSAVATFLSVIGQVSVETGTVHQAIESMQFAVAVMLQEAARQPVVTHDGPNTIQ
jgi:hypothetical protein